MRRILYPSNERDTRTSSPRHENGIELSRRSTASSSSSSSTTTTIVDGDKAAVRRKKGRSITTEVPDTVSSLLEMIRSPELRQKRLDEEERIRSSYIVSETCPFADLTKKVAVIANTETGEVACLEVLKEDTRDNVVTERLESLIKRQIIVQGILMFASERSAELYIKALEDENLILPSVDNERSLVVCEVEAGDVSCIPIHAYTVQS